MCKMGKKKATPSAKKYKKSPDAPRRFKSSYMFFSIEKHRLVREELAAKGVKEKPDTTKVAKIVAQAWKDLSKDEREVFEDLARRDKERYEREKDVYKGPWKVLDKKTPRKKDPNAPKRPMSAFLDYSNSKRSLVKMLHGGELSNAELSRKLAQMWKNASDEEKKVYVEKEAALRSQYKIAIEQWRKDQEGGEAQNTDGQAKMSASSIQGISQHPHAGFLPAGSLLQHQLLSSPATMSSPFAALSTNDQLSSDGPHVLMHGQPAVETFGMENQVSLYPPSSSMLPDQRIVDTQPPTLNNSYAHIQSHPVLPAEMQQDNNINLSALAATVCASAGAIYSTGQTISSEHVASQQYQPATSDSLASTISTAAQSGVAGYTGAAATPQVVHADAQVSQHVRLHDYTAQPFQQSQEHQEDRQSGLLSGSSHRGQQYHVAHPFLQQQEDYLEGSQYGPGFDGEGWDPVAGADYNSGEHRFNRDG